MSFNTAIVRKLESNSYKIFSTIVYLSYFIFFVMSLFILLIVHLANGLQGTLFIYIYLANNGYLILCAFTWLITGHKMVLLISSVSLGIFVIGTIVIIISKRNSMNKCLDCNCLRDLFGRIFEVWELFNESIQKQCSCFYDSSSYCMIAIHYFYTSILSIGLGISTILYIAFSLILVILWCILKIIAESIIACCDCCKKSNIKNSKNSNNVEINNNNGEINNNKQQENKKLTINKQKESLEDRNNNEDIKNKENKAKKYLNKNNYQNSEGVNNENNIKIDSDNNIIIEDIV